MLWIYSENHFLSYIMIYKNYSNFIYINLLLVFYYFNISFNSDNCIVLFKNLTNFNYIEFSVLDVASTIALAP